ncbi:hypothetical protein LTR36_007615 [Oleoguttula mirabilis]|uniref:Arabinanase/levansucrase/invertase n=1 Tax=Oleoguttula mirabilis TaxID=1507867 RepID=A0AAV9JVX1_9PEZI|nr:hypothetical protein LTR36_007615 [Oleoguttula mirabilis]
MGDHLSFWQRHFTKPIDKDPEKYYSSTNRRFAFLSRGSIIAAVAMLLLLLGVIAAAVAVTLDHPHVRAPEVSSPQGAPIRAAIFDNFPDPQLWYNNGTYYAFATNNAAGILQQPANATSYEYGTSNIQIATSTDFLNWTLQPSIDDPLPKTGEWVTQGMTLIKPSIPKANVWAPGIIQRPTDNKFIMYYSADKASLHNGTESAHVPGRHPPPHCIGAAVSETDDPAGPYKPVATALACPIDQGGAIDPAAFQDHDGTLYVTYKIDGNNIGHGGLCGNTKAPIVQTPIKLQKMHPDGTTKDGNETTIMDRIKADGPLVEAPALVRSHEGIYFLFFSSGCTRSPTYDVKYATAQNITGPYERAQYPFLQTGDWGLLAPGSVGVHDDGNGGFNMAFHARVTAPQGNIRAMFTTKLEFNGRVATMVRDNGTSADTS